MRLTGRCRRFAPGAGTTRCRQAYSYEPAAALQLVWAWPTVSPENPMSHRTRSVISSFAVLAAFLACSDSSTGPGSSTHFLTATVDGHPWAADVGSQTLVAELSPAGTLSITGVDEATATSISIGIEVLA